MPRATTEDTLKSILSATDIPNAERINLWDAFFALHALDFAKYLHRTDTISDKVKGELLALRVRTPYQQSDREDILKAAVDDAMAQLWARIGALQER